MTTPPHKNGKPPQKPAEIVGEALEKATDTLSAILKHAALKRSDRAHEQVAHAAEPIRWRVNTPAQVVPSANFMISRSGRSCL